MNLYDATPMIDGLTDKARDANRIEIETYLRWVARSRGIMLPPNAKFDALGVAAMVDGKPVLLLAMPGYGQSQAVTCELLDDAGAVVKTMTLPPKANGSLPMDKAQVKTWTGLTTPRKARTKAAAAPMVETPAPIAETAPVAAPTVEPVAVAPASPDVAAVVAALEARIAALEAGRTVSALPAAANDVDAPARRTAREEAAIRRAWAMRCAMRERADLDRRALMATKDDRDALDVMLTAARAQIAAADRANGTLRQQVRDTSRRADRLVTIATAKRRAAAGDRAALLRVQSDLAGAQAETRAMQRRYSTLKDAVASSPAAAAVVTRKMPTNALTEA